MYFFFHREAMDMVYFLSQDVMDYNYSTKGFLKSSLNSWQVGFLRSL